MDLICFCVIFGRFGLILIGFFCDENVLQPGPRENPIQCFIRRERATRTYRLYLGLSPGKILFSRWSLGACFGIKVGTLPALFVRCYQMLKYNETSHYVFICGVL